jgi:hypothetical protein
MPYNQPITLKVAHRKDFIIPIGFLFALTIVSAVLSPQPVLLTMSVCIIFGAGWLLYILYFHKINDINSISVILPDGRVRLESDQEPEIVGFLSGQQWCTHRVAVLRLTTRDKQKYLVVLSAQQKTDEFRRLEVWLRQKFRNNIGEKPVSGI